MPKSFSVGYNDCDAIIYDVKLSTTNPILSFTFIQVLKHVVGQSSMNSTDSRPARPRLAPSRFRNGGDVTESLLDLSVSTLLERVGGSEVRLEVRS